MTSPGLRRMRGPATAGWRLELIRFALLPFMLSLPDQVMHAVLSGQFVLEQTFHLDVDAMAEPARAPLKVLEAMSGRRLA